MAVYTRHRLFLGFVISLSLTYYLRVLAGQKATARIQSQQELKKQRLREMCDNVKKEFPNSHFEDLSNKKLANLLVNDDHRIIYCYIPKVACTNWKRILYVLTHGMPHEDYMSIEHEEVHKSDMIPHLASLSMTEVKKKLKHYTKFLFVRDPFVRLISAYRDKVQRYQKSFYDLYGRLMLQRYGNMLDPPQTEEEVLASGVRPSFHNFIQYIIDPMTARPLEPHWRPMYQMCHPCVIQYDFIGHQETLQEDAEYLLKILKLDNDFKFPPAYHNMTTKDYVLAWFKSVPIEERRKLYQIYEMDFKLFGYPKPVELLEG